MSQQLEATPLFQKTHITIIPDDLRISLTSAGTWHTHMAHKHTSTRPWVQISASGGEK